MENSSIMDNLVQNDDHNVTLYIPSTANHLIVPIQLQDSSQQQIICHTCNIAFESKRTLALHMKVHNTNRALNISDLPEYEQLSEDQEFQCDLCGKKFPKELQDVHEKSHTSNEAAFLCKICNKSFEDAKSLQMHVSAHNDKYMGRSKQRTGVAKADQGRHGCQYCNKEFEKPCERLQHERIHTGVICSIFEISFF